MNWREHITVDPGVCQGKACFSGRRVMVSVVLDHLACNATAAEILAEYPFLDANAVPAALAYAAELASERLLAVLR